MLDIGQDDAHHPLDNVERILSAHNWAFNRMNDDELMVNVTGKGCDYRLFFLWQNEMEALQLCCQYTLKVEEDNFHSAARALMIINENLWIGHFDIPRETGTPSFRYTSLMPDYTSNHGTFQLEELVDIAMMQCERFFPLFQVLCSDPAANEDHLALALMETKGEC